MKSKSLDVIFDKLPERIRLPLIKARGLYEHSASDIVLRSDRPVCVYQRRKNEFLTESGCLINSPAVDDPMIVTPKEIEEIVLRLCDYSVYAHQNEINQGFITMDGGVRVGLCGKAVMSNGTITNIRDICSLNFRISRDIEHCADPLLKLIDPQYGVLICGVPGSGKTTLLRDMARSLSYRYRVSLLDERGELGAFFRGSAGYDLGLCDVFTGYPKSIAASCALRSMSPEIILCDELGDISDVEMLASALRCGTAFISTIHAASMVDLRKRAIISQLIDTGAFRYIVFLHDGSEVGRIKKVYEMCDRCA